MSDSFREMGQMEFIFQESGYNVNPLQEYAEAHLEDSTLIQEKMLDSFREMSQTEFLFEASGYDLNPLEKNAEGHMEDSPLFAEVGPVFSELEEEIMWLQILLEEPKCNIVNAILDISTLYANQYLDDSAYCYADDEVLRSSFTEGNITVEQYMHGLSEENCNVMPFEENRDIVACEDFLLGKQIGIMLDESGRNLDTIFNQEMFGGDTQFDDYYVDFEGRSCGGYGEALRLSMPTNVVNKGIEEVSPTTEDLLRASSTPFSSVFNFKRKQRMKRAKMKRKVSSCESFQNLCFLLGRSSECDTRKVETSKTQLYGEEGPRVPLMARDKHFQGYNRIPLPPAKDMTIRNKQRASDDDSPIELEEDDDETYHLDESDGTHTSDSEQKRTKRVSEKQRRTHKFWTLTEVTNLVDGVSMYGAGRWADIKRFFFPMSPHRSPGDLKDKWRNLLNVSCGTSRKTRVRAERGIRVSVPQQVLRRVRAVAALHPYPRRKYTKRSL